MPETSSNNLAQPTEPFARALVTGGTRGIGYELAATLVSAGSKVAISSRSAEEGRVAAESLGPSARHFVFDHENWRDTATLVGSAVSWLGGLDVLVNNVGTGAVRSVDDLTNAEIQRLYSLNVSAMMVAARSSLPHLLSSPSGRIVNISSSLALVGREYRSLYSASKGAVVAFTRSLAIELAQTAVTANVIAPGQFHTSLTEGMFRDVTKREAVTSLIPAGRWGEVRELRGVLMALVGQDSGYTNGQVFSVDGGWTTW